MDRAESATWAERTGARRGRADDFLLPSRGKALVALKNALQSQDGPVLLTGEAGVGKTWLCRRLRAAMPSGWRWLSVDLSPAVGAPELYRLILHGLGLAACADPAEARTTLEDVLANGSADGERWGLIVEEGHNASPRVLEELRILGNRMGEPGAFSGLLIVGQNALARRLATRALAPLDARLVARVHLRPIAVEELREFLTRLHPDRSWTVDDVEDLHRAVEGNPRRTLLLVGLELKKTAGMAELPFRASPIPHAPAYEQRAITTAEERPADWDVPPLMPVKPPLHVDEEMIEVGWEPSSDPGTDSESGPQVEDHQTTRSSDEPANGQGPLRAKAGDRSKATEERIDDRYAAIQAWSEWALNQGREPVSAVPPPEPGGTDEGPADELDANDDERPRQAPVSPEHPSVWAEGEHAFAPYSQLFARLRQARDSR